jgi:hypothetical protein
LAVVVWGAKISGVDAATLIQTEALPQTETDGALSQSNSATVESDFQHRR